MVTRQLTAVITALLVLVLDQLIKLVIRATLAPSESIPLVGNLVALTRVHNTGAAFGILGNVQVLVALLSLVIIGILIRYYHDLVINTASAIAIGAILGGALGNLFDRILLGYVLDFIDFGFWPAFNIADIGITLGGALLISTHLFARKV